VLIDPPTKQHQLFPDIAVSNGTAHVIWWDSRYDSSCADASACARQPIGNTADRQVVASSLDAFGTSFPIATGPSGSAAERLSSRSSNPNYEQFGGRTVPFAGDYLWIDSVGGTTYGVWTDWRDTRPGTDARETTVTGTGEPNEGADVFQCRTARADGTVTGDTCPRDGGLDQNIYGSGVS
jgi:hypothetical protein